MNLINMWTCPKCNRVFKARNQSHTCVNKDIGELFINRPDELVLAYDTLYNSVIDWKPNSVGATSKAIVFTSSKAWLIIRVMTDKLDLKFYYQEPIQSEMIEKRGMMGKKHAHHVRIANEEQVNSEMLELLKMGYKFSLSKEV